MKMKYNLTFEKVSSLKLCKVHCETEQGNKTLTYCARGR